jgi:hypothetical protein
VADRAVWADVREIVAIRRIIIAGPPGPGA